MDMAITAFLIHAGEELVWVVKSYLVLAKSLFQFEYTNSVARRHIFKKCTEALSVKKITKSSSTFSATNISSNIVWFLQLHDTIQM